MEFLKIQMQVSGRSKDFFLSFDKSFLKGSGFFIIKIKNSIVVNNEC